MKDAIKIPNTVRTYYYVPGARITRECACKTGILWLLGNQSFGYQDYADSPFCQLKKMGRRVKLSGTKRSPFLPCIALIVGSHGKQKETVALASLES